MPVVSEGWTTSQRSTWRASIALAARRFDATGAAPTTGAPTDTRAQMPSELLAPRATTNVVEAATPTEAAGTAATTFASALRDLEAEVRFAAQTDAWRNTLREGWWSRTTAPRDAATNRALLLELGNNLKLSGMKLDWTQRRQAWATEVQAATTHAQLGALLQELERYLEPSSLFEGWAQKRGPWVQKLRTL